jgi:hypothetical protein
MQVVYCYASRRSSCFPRIASSLCKIQLQAPLKSCSPYKEKTRVTKNTNTMEIMKRKTNAKKIMVYIFVVYIYIYIQRLSNLPVQCNCYLYYVLHDIVPVFLVAALCDVWETSK